MTRSLRFGAFRLAVLLAIFAMACLAADPRLLAMLPGNTEVVAGVDVRAVMSSGIGRELMSSANADAKELNEFIAMTGLDPRKDVGEVVLAGFSAAPGAPKTDADGKPKTDGVAFISGTFDASRIGAALSSRGAKSLMYKGRTLWVPEPEKNKDGDMLTFLDANTVLAGSGDRVKQVLDGNAGAVTAAIKDRATAVGGRYDIWMVSTVSPSKMANGLGGSGAAGDAMGAMQGDMFQKVESLQGGIKFGPTTSIGLEVLSTTEKDAAALMGVLQFFQSMLGARSGGGAAEGQQGPPPALQKLLSGVKMQTEAKTLVISMDMQEADLIAFLRSAQKKAAEESTQKKSGGNEEIIIVQ